MGYKPVVSETAKKLQGYAGDMRSQKANVILPRSQVGSASNDVGFEKKADGTFVAHVSAYDKSSNFNKKKMNKLKQLYAKHRLKGKVKLKGSKYRIKSESVDANGNIKIKIAIRG